MTKKTVCRCASDFSGILSNVDFLREDLGNPDKNIIDMKETLNLLNNRMVSRTEKNCGIKLTEAKKLLKKASKLLSDKTFVESIKKEAFRDLITNVRRDVLDKLLNCASEEVGYNK